VQIVSSCGIFLSPALLVRFASSVVVLKWVVELVGLALLLWVGSSLSPVLQHCCLGAGASPLPRNGGCPGPEQTKGGLGRHQELCTEQPPCPSGDALSLQQVHGHCVCQHNTAGPNCDRCAALYNDRPWAPAEDNDPHECQRTASAFPSPLPGGFPPPSPAVSGRTELRVLLPGRSVGLGVPTDLSAEAPGDVWVLGFALRGCGRAMCWVLGRVSPCCHRVTVSPCHTGASGTL